jgi:hypothetical protein
MSSTQKTKVKNKIQAYLTPLTLPVWYKIREEYQAETGYYLSDTQVLTKILLTLEKGK